jgi:hypothetical protein
MGLDQDELEAEDWAYEQTMMAKEACMEVLAELEAMAAADDSEIITQPPSPLALEVGVGMTAKELRDGVYAVKKGKFT